MAKYHPDKIVPDESEVQGETDTTNQECSKCGKSFDDLIVLAEHFNREHDRIDNRYHCPICPKVIYLGVLSTFMVRLKDLKKKDLKLQVFMYIHTILE